MGPHSLGATLESNTNCHSYSTGVQQTRSTPETPLAQLPDPRTLAGIQTITASRAGDPHRWSPLTSLWQASMPLKSTHSTEAISVGPCSPPVPNNWWNGSGGRNLLTFETCSHHS